MKFLPLFSSISSKNYSGAFLLGAFASSFSASAAIYYSFVQKDRIKDCREREGQKNSPIYCEINNNSIELASMNIFIKTMIIVLIFSHILFITFGYGGGSINDYYKPSFLTIKRGIIHIFSLLFIYFIFHYFAGYYISKHPPKLKNTLKGTLVDLGILGPSKKKSKKSKKNDKKSIFFQILILLIFFLIIFLSVKLNFASLMASSNPLISVL